MLGGLSTQDVLNQRNGMENTINGYLQQQAQAYGEQQKLKTLQALELQNINYGNSLTPDGQVRAGGSTLDAQQAEMNALNAKLNPLQTIADMKYNTAVNALALYKQTPQYQTEQQARDTFFNLAQTYSDVPGGITYDSSKTANENLAIAQQKMQASPKYQASLVNLGGYTDANGVFHTYVRKSPNLGASTQGVSSGQTPTPSNPNTSVGTYSGLPAVKVNQTSVDNNLVDPKTKTGVAFSENWNKGAIGTQKNALNTAIGHIFEANNLFPLLNNSNNIITNYLGNTKDSVLGKSAPTNFVNAASKASNELTAAYGGDTGTERALAQKAVGVSSSPDQWKGYVKTSTELMASKLASFADQYKGAFGVLPPSLDSLILPLNQIKLAHTGVPLEGLVPGVHISPSTQAMINSAVIGKDGKVYLPDANGQMQPQL
jgi:hypothetical protein